MNLPFAKASCRWVCEHRGAAAHLGRILRPGMPWAIVRGGVEHTWASYSQSCREVLLAVPGDALLDQVTAPVTLVSGLADRVPDPVHLRHLAALHPNVRFVEREGDHELPLTDPSWCLALLRQAPS